MLSPVGAELMCTQVRAGRRSHKGPTKHEKEKRMRRTHLRRAGAVSLSLLMILMLLFLNTRLALATDPVRGVEVKVDTSALDASVDAAKQAGVDVQKDGDVDKGTADSEAELNAKRDEIKADYDKQVQDLNAAAEDAKKQLGEYAAKKQKYDEDMVKYNADLAKYNTDMAACNKALEELEQKKNQDGYMTKPSAQMLTFKSEPNAKLSLSGKKYTKEEFKSTVRSWNLGPEPWRYAWFDFLNDNQPEDAARVMLEKDKPFVATYTNLSNSSFNGTKIAKVEYIYTFKGASGVPLPDKLPVVLQKDPADTIWYNDFFADVRINLKARFYDEEGKEIDPTGSLLSFSSLNRGNGSAAIDRDALERVAYFNGEYIPISGSSIKVHADGGAYADSSNAEKAKGSKFDTAEWDTPTSPNAWYGAIIGKVTNPEISLDMASHKSGTIWFAFSSDVKARGVPMKPVAPTPPVEPKKPVIKANYHVDILYTRPQLGKGALDEADADIDGSTVKTGSIVKFALRTSAFPADHETIDSVVFRDTLPENYEVDLDATKAASPDYDVSYDGASRNLVFTAKATLIAQINADLTKAAEVPAPMVIGKVMKDGTTYENSFDIDINNSYSAKSNIVRVQTPKAQPIILPAAGGPGTLLPVTLLSVLAVVSGAAWLFTRRREVWRGAGAWYGREAYSPLKSSGMRRAFDVRGKWRSILARCHFNR